MNHQLMTQQQRSSSQPAARSGAQWMLETGEALSIDIGPGAREIHVTQGRLWLTRAGTLNLPADDIWVDAGQSLAVEHGSRWVVEGAASFQLLVPPSACARMARQVKASIWRRVSSWLQPVWPMPLKG